MNTVNQCSSLKSSNMKKQNIRLKLFLAWAFVGLPMLFGVAMTMVKALALFR
jgi:hypothetical protein